MSISLEAPVVRAKSERHSSLSPAQIMEIARAREASLSRLLMAYISSGLVFMLLPGTFLGVWNLLQISGRESTASISPAWIQAHGPAPYDRMYSSRFQRGSRISGICKLGVVRIAGLGAARIDGDHRLRHEYFWHVHSRAQSRAETALGRGDKLGTFI
jgi:hypothetical protein